MLSEKILEYNPVFIWITDPALDEDFHTHQLIYFINSYCFIYYNEDNISSIIYLYRGKSTVFGLRKNTLLSKFQNEQ